MARWATNSTKGYKVMKEKWIGWAIAVLVIVASIEVEGQMRKSWMFKGINYRLEEEGFLQKELYNGSPATTKESLPSENPVGRIMGKLGAGFILGTFSALTLGGYASTGVEDGIVKGIPALNVARMGFTLGSAFGVSIIDPHDRFLVTLAGGLVGTMGGAKVINVDFYSGSWSLVWSYVVFPLVGSTIASELYRPGRRIVNNGEQQ